MTIIFRKNNVGNGLPTEQLLDTNKQSPGVSQKIKDFSSGKKAEISFKDSKSRGSNLELLLRLQQEALHGFYKKAVSASFSLSNVVIQNFMPGEKRNNSLNGEL